MSFLARAGHRTASSRLLTACEWILPAASALGLAVTAVLVATDRWWAIIVLALTVLLGIATDRRSQ